MGIQKAKDRRIEEDRTNNRNTIEISIQAFFKFVTQLISVF